MPTTAVQPEYRTPERIRADEEIAASFERNVVVDCVTGRTIHAAEDERRRLAESLVLESNNAIAPGGMDVPFLWDGTAFRITRACYRDGAAEVEVSPLNPALELELRRRIEKAPHHVLTFYQGYGFVCFAEDHARYQDFQPRNG